METDLRLQAAVMCWWLKLELFFFCFNSLYSLELFLQIYHIPDLFLTCGDLALTDQQGLISRVFVLHEYVFPSKNYSALQKSYTKGVATIKKSFILGLN